MLWWLWIILGLALLVGELFIPSGFFLCIIGLGSLLTGILVLLGIGGPFWVQALFCAAVSTVLALWMRKLLLGRSESERSQFDQGPIGEEIVIRSQISPGGVGEGELRGSMWSVRNDGVATLEPGQRCKVVKVEGLTLSVR